MRKATTEGSLDEAPTADASDALRSDDHEAVRVLRTGDHRGPTGPGVVAELAARRARRQLIEHAGGEIVAEYFDIGQSRSLPWKRRPEARRLLEALTRPDRGFDAVVIGEPQRAFYGNQFGLTFPLFVHYGVQLWVPEVGGAVDPGNDAHDLVMASTAA